MPETYAYVRRQAAELRGILMPDLTQFDAVLADGSKLSVPTVEDFLTRNEAHLSETAAQYAQAWREEIVNHGGARAYYRHGDIIKAASFAPTAPDSTSVARVYGVAKNDAIDLLNDLRSERDVLEQYQRLVEVHVSRWVIEQRTRIIAKREADYRLLVAHHIHSSQNDDQDAPLFPDFQEDQP